MEKLVILIVIGIISLVNWLIQRSAELRERQKLEKHRAETGEETEQLTAKSARNLMEVFRMLREEPAPAPKQQPPNLLPPLIVKPPAIPERWKPAAAQYQSLKSTTQNKIHSLSENRWTKILSSHDGIRQAIVLREILGAPKAFTL